MYVGMPGFRTRYPWTELRCISAGASVVFYIPIARELLLLFGVRDATRSNVCRMLDSGRSVALVCHMVIDVVSSLITCLV